MQSLLDVLEGNYGDITKMPLVVNKEAFVWRGRNCVGPAFLPAQARTMRSCRMDAPLRRPTLANKELFARYKVSG